MGGEAGSLSFHRCVCLEHGRVLQGAQQRKMVHEDAKASKETLPFAHNRLIKLLAVHAGRILNHNELLDLLDVLVHVIGGARRNRKSSGALPFIANLVDVTQNFSTICLDYANVAVRTRAEIVVDACGNAAANEVPSLVGVQALSVLAFKNGHGSKAARAHGNIWQLVDRTVGVHGVQMRAGAVHTANDKSGGNLALVAIEHSRQHGHSSGHAVWATRAQAMQRQI